MQLTIINACLLAMVSAISMCQGRTIKSTEESLWDLFKTTYDKQYTDSAEDQVRRTIWKANLDAIAIHNNLADLGVHSHRLGMNKFADLTSEEYRKQYLLKKPIKHTKEGSTFLTKLTVESNLQDQVDWRSKGYVTPVKNQGMCGSCWAFSATGSLEGQNFRKTGKLISLSEQQLVDCSERFGNDGCDGGLMDNAFKYVKKAGGIESEKDYPYKAKDQKCKFDKTKVKGEDTGFVDITANDEDALKEAVATVGPVSVGIDASGRDFQLYRSGVYNPDKCSSVTLDHGVLVVGYGTTDAGEDYWLVKNSWSTSWGEQGYIRMARNKKNKCGIASAASYPLV